MAEFSKLVITNKGQALLAKMIAGSGNIEFTQISASSTAYTTDAQLVELTSLTDVKQTSLISKITRTNEVAIEVEAAFTNTELTEGYHMRVLGLYAKDPDNDEEEILYAVTREISGNCYMPAYNGITVSGAYVQLITTVGNAESVSLEVNQAAVATIKDITALNNRVTAAEQNIEDLENGKFIYANKWLNYTPTIDRLPDNWNINRAKAYQVATIGQLKLVTLTYEIIIKNLNNDNAGELDIGPSGETAILAAEIISEDSNIIAYIGPTYSSVMAPMQNAYRIRVVGSAATAKLAIKALALTKEIPNE